MAPLISICIPSYNNEEFIRETIHSVLNQSYRNIELIISDDASTDNTLEVAKKSTENCAFPVTIVSNEKNLGLEGNWNAALKLATGKYVKVLPADDVLSAGCIKQQVEIMETHENIALTFSARSITTKSGRELLTARFYNNDEEIESKKLVTRCITSGTNVIGEPGAVLFSRSTSNKVGLFDGSKPYVIDLDYWTRLLQYGNGYVTNNKLCTFRIDSNLSVRLGLQRVTDYLSTINILQKNWNINRLVCLYGKARTLINEVLRRVVHMYFKFIG